MRYYLFSFLLTGGGGNFDILNPYFFTLSDTDSSDTNLVYFGNYQTIIDSKLSLSAYHIHVIHDFLVLQLNFQKDILGMMTTIPLMKIMNLVLIYQ